MEQRHTHRECSHTSGTKQTRVADDDVLEEIGIVGHGRNSVCVSVSFLWLLLPLTTTPMKTVAAAAATITTAPGAVSFFSLFLLFFSLLLLFLFLLFALCSLLFALCSFGLLEKSLVLSSSRFLLVFLLSFFFFGLQKKHGCHS